MCKHPQSYVAYRLSFVVYRLSFVVYRLSFLLVPLLASCSSGSSYMPSEVGTAWTYKVRTGFGAQHVVDATISRKLSVTGTEGFELVSALGPTRMAWKNGALWAQNFGNVHVQPAISIFRIDREPADWKGTLQTVQGKEAATGKLTHENKKLEIGSRSLQTVQSQLTIKRPNATTILTTWLSEGIGIVRQEQRTNGALDLRIEWVSGPRGRAN